MNNFDTPILIIGFNRFDTIERVFMSVREVRPEKLFIALDGPRDDVLSDKENCDKVKKVFTKIDWDCEVKTLYRNKNMGCDEAVPDSISWFFSNVEEGIILEDDCLPSRSFFSYCKDLLAKYRDNDKVMMISGNNFISDYKFSEDSFFFSKYAFIWGWATWRRAWEKFDNSMKSYPSFKKNGGFRDYYPNILDRFFWRTGFENKYNGYSQGWDMKWNYALAYYNGLDVIPSTNLVRNIGMESDATHTKKYDKRMDIPTYDLDFPLKYPDNIEECKIYDKKIFKRNFLSTVNVYTILKNYRNILIKKIKR
mgnify:CR=1 FL=1